MSAEPFEIAVPDAVLDDLRSRLERTRWHDQRGEATWELGTDVAFLRELCRHWAQRYDWRAFERRLNELENVRWEGLHAMRVGGGGEGLPVVLIHGWPGAPIEYLDVMPRLATAGHDAIAPSLPGFAWSDAPDEPPNTARMSAALRALAEDGLGLERYAVVGGDWGAPIAARMAFDAPDKVGALYVFTPGTLPPAGDLEQPPLSEAEQGFVQDGLRWRNREGHHLFVQSTIPDALAVGLNDSPAGLAAYLVEKYRRWGDEGEFEHRFSLDELCNYLTIYWTTATIGSSMRLYLGERRERWRPAAGEQVEVPAAAGIFPHEIINPPREWTERLLPDLRSWTEMPRGGHFAAREEPELLCDDLLAFLAEVA